MKRIEVVAGVFKADGKVLIARRRQGKSLAGFWEFPGGKIERGEGPVTALIRELKEELNVDVVVGEHILNVEHNYDDFTIYLMAFGVRTDKKITTSNDHDLFEWIDPKLYVEYNIAPADIPILKAMI